MKKVIQILLVLAIIFLAYKVYTSISTPIDFQREQKMRSDAVVESLKNIRKAQLAYKEVNGKFTANWDSLVNFVKTGKIPLVRKIGTLTDAQLEEGLTEAEALKKGIIIRDTVRVAVRDSLFGKDFNIDRLPYIPYSKDEKFFLGTNKITTGSGVQVNVFEARAHNNQFLGELKGTFDQEIINLNEKRRIDGKYPGLKVGSLTETNNNAGNWE
jgi:hypothetical protein